MQGYGREVYITENDDVSYVKLNGKEYELETRDYYDEETGDKNYHFTVKDTKGKEVYDYYENFDLNNDEKSCSQNIFVVDDDFLKEISRISQKELPKEQDLKEKELERSLKYGKNSLEIHPLSNLFKERKIEFNETFESLKKEAIGFTIKENSTENKTPEEYSSSISNYIQNKIDYFYETEMSNNENAREFLKDFYEELNLNINDIEFKDLDFKSIVDKEISKTTQDFLEKIDNFSDESLKKTFKEEVEEYENTPVKYVDEVKKEMKENFLKIRNFKEERVKNRLDDEITVTKKDFEKHTFYKCTEEEVKQLNLEYKEEKDINITDKEYANKIYNQHYIEKYKPLSIIDEYPEIKAEVLERLPFDFGEVLPPFQVYNSNEMFYDSGTQELGETTETFMKSLIGEMAWDFMNVDNIIEWYQVAEEHPNTFSIVYFEKNDKGEFDDSSIKDLIKDFTCYNDYADYSEKAIKERLDDMLRHKPSLYKKIEENVIAVQKEAGVYQEKTFGDVNFLEITSEKEEVKEEVKNMKGYGKEVYITESDDTTEKTIKGEKYTIETTSYYDDETGDSSFKIVAKNENGARVYEYSEYSDFDNYSEECYQDTSVVDNEFLKELNKMTDKKLPTQEEIENKYPELKKEVDKEDSKLQNLKNYLGSAVNVENEIEKFSDKMEEIVDKLDLIDKLPVFKVMTEDGILYSSDKGSVDFQDKDGNMVYERTKLFDDIKNKMGEEFFNNMNMNDIRDWEDFKNNSDITLVYDSYGEEGDYCLKEYSDFNSYAKETVKPFLVQEILKNPELADILKEDIIKDEKVKETKEKEEIEKSSNKNDKEIDF